MPTKKTIIIAAAILTAALVLTPILPVLAQSNQPPASSPATQPSAPDQPAKAPAPKEKVLSYKDAKEYERAQRLVLQANQSIMEAEKLVADRKLQSIQFLQIRDNLLTRFRETYHCAGCTIDDSALEGEWMNSSYRLVPPTPPEPVAPPVAPPAKKK